MTSEADLNNIIRKSIIHAGGWAYKIPDPIGLSALTASMRAFDGFGVLQGIPLYWEAKFANAFYSFNLSLIQDHQIHNLLQIKKLLPMAYCFICYGVRVKRGDNRVFIFNDIEILADRRIKKQNYLKKELETLPYFKVQKGALIDFTL